MKSSTKTPANKPVVAPQPTPGRVSLNQGDKLELKHLSAHLHTLTREFRDWRDEQKLIEVDRRQTLRELATKKNLLATEKKIMSAISDFADKQKAFNDRLDTAVADLQGDITALNTKIQELQDSAGKITAEDQALLNDIETRSDGIATKLEALAAETPPTPVAESLDPTTGIKSNAPRP